MPPSVWGTLDSNTQKAHEAFRNVGAKQRQARSSTSVLSRALTDFMKAKR